MYNEVKLKTGNHCNKYSVIQELDCASYNDPSKISSLSFKCEEKWPLPYEAQKHNLIYIHSLYCPSFSPAIHSPFPHKFVNNSRSKIQFLHYMLVKGIFNLAPVSVTKC